MKFFTSLTIALSLVAISTVNAEGKKTLTVYTYSSFVSDWGPGPLIKQRFEKTCDCELIFVSVEDGSALLSRLKLEGVQSKADIVLGLDSNLMVEAKNTGLLSPHGINIADMDLLIQWTDNTFLPYDYGYFALVYDSDAIKDMPKTLEQFIEDVNGPKLIIQDPRTSTPGLGLLLWIRSIYGDDASRAWSTLKPRILTVTKGWSEAYGLFLEGEAPIVLSYTTSPAYHLHVENTDRYKAAEFSDGHYAQIEVAAKLAQSEQSELATEFLTFMLSPGFQDVIPTTNWMFPVAATYDPLPEAFQNLVKPKRTLLFESTKVANQRRQWVREWLDTLSH